MQTTILQQQVKENTTQPPNEIMSLKLVIGVSLALGLVLNWLAMYLRVGMGFIGVGIGPMIVLLIARSVFKRRNVLSRKNLVVVSIVYGATAAVEASIGLLFLVWFATNVSGFFGTAYVAPAWLLPPPEVLASQQLFHAAWIVPLLVHYFLMLIPGVLGIAVGWMYKEQFIKNEEAYPFPSVINLDTSVGVLTDKAETKGPIFWRFVKYGFAFALLTVLIPQLFIIDFSTPTSLIGIMLGPIGLALFAGGMLIGKIKISGTTAVSSILIYSVLSIFLITPIVGLDPFEQFGFMLQERYLSAAIGVLLGAILVGPLLWGILGGIFGKKREENGENKDDEQTQEMEEIELDETTPKSRFGYLTQWRVWAIFLGVYALSVGFVLITGIFGDTSLIVILGILFWILVIGGMVNGYLMIQGLAKSGSVIAAPFIFDWAPIFLSGIRGPTAFLAAPLSESDGTAGLVASQKLANMNAVPRKTALLAYIAGYGAATLTTPLFALFLWRSFGIGTTSFPAPAFPVQGALLMAFASGNLNSFLSVTGMLIFLGVGALLAKIDKNIAFGAALGFFFPPHMAIPFALGGIIRYVMERRNDKEIVKDEVVTKAPALAVGGSFVIPILIILAFL